MKHILILLCLSLFALSERAQAQDSGFDNEELLGIVYDDEFTIDLRVHTHGYLSLAANRAKIRTYYRTTYYQVELGILKHSKESRNDDVEVPLPNGFNPKSYVFGKQNSMFVARGGYGIKRYFSEKQERKGVAIGISALGGVSLGVLKPYYLDLRRNDGDGNFIFQHTPYTEDVADDFLSVGNILGASGFRYGWGDLSAMPGIHAKVGVHLDWGAFDEVVKAIEFGFMLDAYYKKVPIMITERNTPVFLNVYLALQLGKRW